MSVGPTSFSCNLCALHPKAKGDRFVLGNGNLSAEIVVITDAPSKEDARCGIPMSSHFETTRNGDVDLLVQLIKEAGLPPQSIYRTTLVKCRAPLDNYGNSLPVKDEEVAACHRYLDQELSHIKPKIIIAMGPVTVKRLLGAKSIGSVQNRAVDSAKVLGFTWATAEKKMVTRKKAKVEIAVNRAGAFSVLSTYSFAMVRRNPSYLDPIRRVFIEAGKMLRGEAAAEPLEYDYRYGYTEPEVYKLLGDVFDRTRSESRLFFDLETSGLNWYPLLSHPHVAKTLTTAFGFKEREITAVSMRDHVRSTRVMALYKDILQSKTPKTGHNGKFDVGFLRGELGIRVREYDFDTMLAAWQLKQGTPVGLDKFIPIHRPDLGLYWEEVGKKLDKRYGYLKAPDEELLLYNAKDVDATITLFNHFEPEIRKRDLQRCFTEITMPHQAEAMEMEFVGVQLDVEATKELGRRKLRERDAALAKLYEITGKHPEGLTNTQLVERGLTVETYKPFNPGSGPQVAKILFDEMKLPVTRWTNDQKTTPSVDEEALEELRGRAPFIDALLDYRGLTKQLSTNIGWERKADGSEGILDDPKSGALLCVVDASGRVHTSINIHGTATGRTSSSSPNLQNIPKTAEFRSLFIAAPGFQLGDSDYASLELRILAYLSGDRALIKAFNDGVDLHSATGAGIFGLTLADFEGVEYYPDPTQPKTFELFKSGGDVKKKYPDATPAQTFERKNRKERKVGKNINFGVVYGKGAASLASELGITKAEAQSYLDGWSRTYPEAAAWIQRMFRSLEQTGVVRYSIGRERQLPTIFSNRKSDQNEARRQCINTPVQGTGSDCTSLAVIHIGRRLREELGVENARLVLEIHDQVVVEFRPEFTAQVEKIVIEEMERPKPMLDQTLGLNLVAEYDEKNNLGKGL